MSQNRLVVDLHLHSRFSMATSPQLNLETLEATGRRKGINLLAAPDFTHPVWREEMLRTLEEVNEGTYRLKATSADAPQHSMQASLFSSSAPSGDTEETSRSTVFVPVTEISCIWYHGGRSRRVHVLLMAPSLEAAERISAALSHHQDLLSDGRPMIKMSAEHLYSLVLEIDELCVLFPAHAWTPWYGVYGSKSGFDSLEECFGEHAKRVPAIETGLSSNPEMNWSVSDIGKRSIVSFSDAHSPATMGRELTVLDAEPSYESVRSALFENRVVETVEFHPEHGKYHMNGHRKCGVKLEPAETPSDGKCRGCGRPLTLGVLHRISELADRPSEQTVLKDGLLYGKGPHTRPFRQLVALRELLSQALEVGVGAKKVTRMYDRLINEVGNELDVLTKESHDSIASVVGEQTASLVVAVREGRVEVDAGFDGVYGKVTAKT